MRFRRFALVLLLAAMGCAGPGLLASEPMGKQLERALEEIKKDCIDRGAPPFGADSGGTKDSSCLMFTLKPWEPGDTPESAFAHSIKLPPPHDKPKDVYKPGMSSEAYFKALCEAEAGEWVFRRVEGVKGIRQERPNRIASPGESSLVFWASEPVVATIFHPREVFEERLRHTWQFVERRISQSDPKKKAGEYEYFDRSLREGEVRATASSNYAFIGRGIRRPFDREHAISGDEFIVYQIEPYEVLGIQRSFVFYFPESRTRQSRLPGNYGCPGALNSYEFLRDVLKPIASTYK